MKYGTSMYSVLCALTKAADLARVEVSSQPTVTSDCEFQARVSYITKQQCAVANDTNDNS